MTYNEILSAERDSASMPQEVVEAKSIMLRAMMTVLTTTLLKAHCVGR